MPNISEYNKPSVGASSCSYTTLNNYNQNFFGQGAIGAPQLSQVSSNEIVVVPSYGGVGGYGTLSQKQPSCSGYFNLNSAYPAYGYNCGAYASNLCGNF